MFKTTIAVMLSVVSFGALADNGMESTPFVLQTGYVDSEYNTGNNDTVVLFEADLETIQVKNIVVDHGECKPYKTIPNNYIVPKGEAFKLTFYNKNHEDCKGDTILIETNKGNFEVTD